MVALSVWLSETFERLSFKQRDALLVVVVVARANLALV